MSVFCVLDLYYLMYVYLYLNHIIENCENRAFEINNNIIFVRKNKCKSL